MPENSLGRAIGELFALPFVLVLGLFRAARLAVAAIEPLARGAVAEKNRARVVGAVGALVACIVFAAHGFPVVGAEPTAGIAAFALLYLVVGIVGTVRAERLTFDLMAVFWRCALVIGCVALLIYAKLGAL